MKAAFGMEMNPNRYVVIPHRKCPYGNHFTSFDKFNEREVVKFYNNKPALYRVFCGEAKKSYGIIFGVEWKPLTNN